MEERIGIQIIVMLEIIIIIIIQYRNGQQVIYPLNCTDFEVRIHQEVFSTNKKSLKHHK